MDWPFVKNQSRKKKDYEVEISDTITTQKLTKAKEQNKQPKEQNKQNRTKAKIIESGHKGSLKVMKCGKRQDKCQRLIEDHLTITTTNTVVSLHSKGSTNPKGIYIVFIDKLINLHFFDENKYIVIRWILPQ